MVDELARIYDLQNSPQYRDEMTCIDPDTGQRISVSWLFPRSAEDLRQKRRNSELWNELSWGQLGRSPDILAPYILSALHLKDEFGAVKHHRLRFRREPPELLRILQTRHDLFLTHALGDPQVDRSQQTQNERRAVAEDNEVALHVVEETKRRRDHHRRQAAIDRGAAQPRGLRLAVGHLRSAQQSALRACLRHSDRDARPEDPGARAGFALVRLVGAPVAEPGRAGLHALLRAGAGPLGPAVHALRPDTDGEDAGRRRSQRRVQLPRLGQSRAASRRACA